VTPLDLLLHPLQRRTMTYRLIFVITRFISYSHHDCEFALKLRTVFLLRVMSITFGA
jgi:hypothetical protein